MTDQHRLRIFRTCVHWLLLAASIVLASHIAGVASHIFYMYIGVHRDVASMLSSRKADVGTYYTVTTHIYGGTSILVLISILLAISAASMIQQRSLFVSRVTFAVYITALFGLAIGQVGDVLEYMSREWFGTRLIIPSRFYLLVAFEGTACISAFMVWREWSKTLQLQSLDPRAKLVGGILLFAVITTLAQHVWGTLYVLPAGARLENELRDLPARIPNWYRSVMRLHEVTNQIVLVIQCASLVALFAFLRSIASRLDRWLIHRLCPVCKYRIDEKATGCSECGWCRADLVHTVATSTSASRSDMKSP